MTHARFAIRRPAQSERMLRWQVAVNTAFAGGSLIAALMNLGALVAFSLSRFASSRFATARRVGSIS